MLTKGWKPSVEAGTVLSRLSVLQITKEGITELLLWLFLTFPNPSQSRFRLGSQDADPRVNSCFMEARTKTPWERVGESMDVCACVYVLCRCLCSSILLLLSSNYHGLHQLNLQPKACRAVRWPAASTAHLGKKRTALFCTSPH